MIVSTAWYEVLALQNQAVYLTLSVPLGHTNVDDYVKPQCKGKVCPTEKFVSSLVIPSDQLQLN